jgi:RNA recognition motif-containing protein
MSFTVFLGNLPAWVTADDIKGWLSAENLVADAIKVIRNPETQESKGFAFIEAPNHDEMNAIIRRFDRAPLEDRLLRANPAQPPKPRGQAGQSRVTGSSGTSSSSSHGSSHGPSHGSGGQGGQSGQAVQGNGGQVAAAAPAVDQRPPRRGKKSAARRPSGSSGGPNSAFAEELAKAL